jgi:hypothetical protein
MMERRYLNAIEGKKDGVYQDRNLMVGLQVFSWSQIIESIGLDMDLDEEEVSSYSMAVPAGSHDS